MEPEAIDSLIRAMNDMMRDAQTPSTIIMSPRTLKLVVRTTMRKREYRRWRGRMKADYRRWLITHPSPT